ncbi:thiol-disulfide isomerase/thioredoxin [Ulvibacter sp. MAR_2010_11]|uniref:TlpA disulfide reductase family protein n=1 Tax=Ulvibacter sp. MAR_2010_11 TaxID=1250229 RepID=UPI000C2BDA5D|nr:TlpA disulfide reductase family protein [Ulvibacter sp. MAR_2010_11]PKA83582.1 thiol-disulfide isomerase/thioredoxin [Ulvibacter sp. MAR_2010_11]
MKYILGIVTCCLLTFCGNNNSDTTATETVTSDANNTKETAKQQGKIPMYSFNELQPLLSKDNDTTYVVNFWATWCKPCIKEMPYFEKLNSDYAKDKVKVVFVSLDFPDKLETQVIPFIEKNNIKSQVVLLDDTDANTWIPKVSSTWEGSIPATLIYNSATRHFFERSFTYEELEKELKNVL